MSKNIIATYVVTGRDSLEQAAKEIAIGQSIGNPYVRNEWETDELIERHSAKILDIVHDSPKSGLVKIGFPTDNIDPSDGVTQLLVQLMGGQSDIGNVERCRLIGLELPTAWERFTFPRNGFGIKSIRKYLHVYDRPLVGGIMKPKVGLSPAQLLDMTKQMVDGGVDFIKEDEILGNPRHCPLEARLRVIVPYLDSLKNPPIYCFTINADPGELAQKYLLVDKYGGPGVHLNFWAGFGSYKSLRDLNRPIFMHFQRSGISILTEPTNKYSISWNVICKFIGLIGCDFAHVGMLGGGYSGGDDDETLMAIETLREYGVMPALSCGMHPGLVEKITARIGIDYLANCGGSMHGHPGGTTAGAKAMAQAVRGQTDQPEFLTALERFGK